ncbi:M64 family metallopeptidase [Sphingobacterium sp. E70]|nr:M64 family metallopeptidase [Sphingobacterium sp. E70]ULT22222.1 M64 family metallopeptidase [Sphingobacterium sp. E70]
MPVTHPNTIFGSSFDNGGLHRLVVPQKNERIEEVLKTHIPNYTQVVILVNSPFYGGSGGKWATSTVNFKSNDIAVHEIGHSFAQLADEYWAGNQYAIESVNRSQTAAANAVPWKHWLGKDGVGIYSYGGKDLRPTGSGHMSIVKCNILLPLFAPSAKSNLWRQSSKNLALLLR